uniref:Nuclear pore complex protein NUP1 n=1 Tax=Oryza punctata TaxID=4537 RepID=A0A0E0LDC4_ORYPU
MDGGRRWQSPAAVAAAAEGEDAGGYGVGGAGGPSRRPPRRGLNRASPYGTGAPRRWLPKLPVASRIFPSLAQDHAAAASDNNQMDWHESLEVTNKTQRHSIEQNTNSTALDNKASLLQEERLIEIMRSRTPDLFNEDQRVPRSSTKGFEAIPFSDRWSTPAKQIDVRSPCGTDVFVPSNVLDVASSPIELAKAYMEAQTSASVQESQKRKFRALSHGVEVENSSSKVFPKIATDSPVCWPGSVVRNYPNYLTPQSNKGRTLPPTSSRTTYIGSVFPRSNKAIFEDKTAPLGVVLGAQPSTTYSKGVYGDTVGTATPLFAKEGSSKKIDGSTLQGHHGKDTTESGSSLGFVSMVDNIPHSKSAALSVHPKSSKTAHKILQHLERTIPSPTAKPLELRWTSAKRTTSSVVTNIQHKGPATDSHRHSSINDSGRAQQEISDANKVLAPPSSYNAVESSPKIQNSGSKSMPSSQHTSKSDSATTSAAQVLDKSTGNGLTFTFPVPKTSMSLPEPPPTPTLSLPPSIPSADGADIPKFTFGSSSTTDKLVFSFDLASSSPSAKAAAPTFKFGSDTKRDLSFDVAGKDAVCF